MGNVTLKEGKLSIIYAIHSKKFNLAQMDFNTINQFIQFKFMQTDNSNKTQLDFSGENTNTTISYGYRKCDVYDFGSI